MKQLYLTIILLLNVTFLYAQTPKPPYSSSKFEQLGEELPTPNIYRAGSGAPGHEYWQQQADYFIKVRLDDDKQYITATETITYTNNSPNDLKYLWVQLDQNKFDKNSDTYQTSTGDLSESLDHRLLGRVVMGEASEGGYKISNVRDESNKPLKFLINKTMMRVELPQVLKAKGGKVTFSLDWEYQIMEQKKMGGRAGFEYFPKDGNYLYEIAQWFPRMCVYDDVNGWQNKQFLGRGEFALTFGDYEVHITAPADHLVASTGVLQNPKDVLTPLQMARLNKAKNATDPVLIVSEEEVKAKERKQEKNTKTWIYKAKNVRDFAWASSRKFIWDAMGVEVGGKKVMAMSYYPKEGNPLWGQYSTQVVAHTLRVYSRYTFDYPYPVAISVHGPVFGMEYPMICFNGGRPNPDGSVPEYIRRAMISVITHEVGHNFFPMIVNSDERQWTWMDEGLNSFCQYLAEKELPQQAWAKEDYPNSYPSRRGPAKKMVPYMKSDPNTMVPIMNNSESIPQFGNNAYGKPATALNVLREVVMGHELFDYAFKEYATRWAFKHPMPADFFRTMEDASAVDLDWFWRGWFYTTEPCDITISEVRLFKVPGGKAIKNNDPFEVYKFSVESREDIVERIESKGGTLSKADKAKLDPKRNFYTVSFENRGGLIMPILLQINYKDGTSEMRKIPAEVWRMNPEHITKIIPTEKEVKSFELDPEEKTADINTDNNIYPREESSSELEKFKEGK